MAFPHIFVCDGRSGGGGGVPILLSHKSEVSALVWSTQEQDTAPEATDCARRRHITDI